MGLAGSAMKREEVNSEVTETKAEEESLVDGELLEASASSEMAEGSLYQARGFRDRAAHSRVCSSWVCFLTFK